jgi:hypothetical protein
VLLLCYNSNMASNTSSPAYSFKKPLNQLNGPLYPDIRRALPRFVDSKKHWTVDAGATLMEHHNDVQRYENAILVQPYDYNTRIYGQSSHRSVVNEAFRPPLQDRDDFIALSRQPRKEVVPRINPESQVYKQQINRQTGIDSYLTDRIQTGVGRATLFYPIDLRPEQDMVPDLELKRPAYSADAKINSPVLLDAPIQEKAIEYEKITPPFESGFSTIVRDQLFVPVRDLPKKTSSLPLDAGFLPDYKTKIDKPDVHLLRKTPSHHFDINREAQYELAVPHHDDKRREKKCNPSATVVASTEMLYKDDYQCKTNGFVRRRKIDPQIRRDPQVVRRRFEKDGFAVPTKVLSMSKLQQAR